MFYNNGIETLFTVGPFSPSIIDSLDLDLGLVNEGLDYNAYQIDFVKADIRWGLGYQDYRHAVSTGQSGIASYHVLNPLLNGICSEQEVLIPLP